MGLLHDEQRCKVKKKRQKRGVRFVYERLDDWVGMYADF